ncbi:ABC transporter ATP-binding protein [Noviherbaspirillum galbum]|uniref:ATP-binding cassette domain-containing protein n=1 Tax=Noviherbaspirillum galbum TaxID=2709383 RepID=A0A6B3STP7_9BURK|nr:ABC transporter transmembrane domain-containing protein [Noviherbaspirillum galbum]NEX63981.1 ATP-binding cassette domain-containing protein [Noviherbaspirillum galbum]
MRSEHREALSLLRDALRPERGQLLRGVAWLLAAAGLEVLGPILGKLLIDDYLLPRRFDPQWMTALLAGSLLTGVLASALRYFQLVRLSELAMRSVRRLREAVYEHVLRLPMSFFDKAITGQLVSRVTNDTEAVKMLYIQVLFVILNNGILLLGTMIAMAWLDWRLMLIVAALVPAVAVIVWLYQRWSAPAVTHARALRSDINAQMAESINGMAVLQATNAAGRFGARFVGTNRSYYTARLAEVRANAWLLRPALDFLNILLLVAVIFSFSRRELGGIEIGILYAFVGYIARVVEPLIQITLQFSQLQQSMVAASRVNALLRETPAMRKSGDARVAEGRLRLRGIEFGYDPAQPVLHHLDLDIPAGDFVGIVGHTGSGKSTLLSLMLRFYRPQQGSITIDDIAIEQIGDDAFRADVGLVPQEPFLLAASARENIDMGRGLHDDDIREAARKARAHEFIEALERGYDTPLGEGGARLSTGQKQLVAIARALAGKPRILFLDEATSHIDSETEQVVQRALNDLRGQVTIVAIAHRLSTIRHAHRIIVLNHGRIAEAGAHDQLMNIDGGIYQRLYQMQQLEE